MTGAGRETTHFATQLDPRAREREIVRLASRQHGVVSLAQLQELGLTASGVRARAARARLHSVHRGVYAVGRERLDDDGRHMAAALACGQGAAISHLSAAGLHGFLSPAPVVVDVTVNRRGGMARAGIRIHRSGSIRARDRSEARGIPCTTVPRTLVDLAGVLGVDTLRKAVNEAQRLKLLDEVALADALRRARGRPGTRHLRAILRIGDPEPSLTRSELEDRFLALIESEGLPRPQVNVRVPVEAGVLEVDFSWPESRLIVETDGYGTHGTRQSFKDDRWRDRQLSRAGWRVSRFTWDDVVGSSAMVAPEIRTLLEG